MSASLARVRANRVNSVNSTGPRTPAGLARVSQNAIKVGLFSRHLVLPTLGESVEDYDAFRSAIVVDLNPVGAVEAELADRVGVLLWRLRRVTRYESAAMAATLGELPPHPNDVTPLTGNGVFLPVPPGAPTVFRLAHLRALMLGSGEAISSRRAGADALDVGIDDRSHVDLSAVGRVLDTAAEELSWFVVPDPWPAVLAAAGFKPHRVGAVEWTARRLRRILKCAAGTAGRTFEEVRDAIRERLRAAAEELERIAAERRAEEARLAAELVQERERAAAARAYADEALVQRVARAEAHLSRELDRALALLAHRRAERAHEPTAAQLVGFVLQNAVPANRPIGATGSETG